MLLSKFRHLRPRYYHGEYQKRNHRTGRHRRQLRPRHLQRRPRPPTPARRRSPPEIRARSTSLRAGPRRRPCNRDSCPNAGRCRNVPWPCTDSRRRRPPERKRRRCTAGRRCRFRPSARTRNWTDRWVAGTVRRSPDRCRRPWTVRRRPRRRHRYSVPDPWEAARASIRGEAVQGGGRRPPKVAAAPASHNRTRRGENSTCRRDTVRRRRCTWAPARTSRPAPTRSVRSSFVSPRSRFRYRWRGPVSSPSSSSVSRSEWRTPS
mmetsp:Transcript_38922/g.93639  ORF Transcript_38922/g.93639 Transcript_38922/m.93639 type:complete len:263 (+) Transcript_38922:743-1531(+)